MRMMSTVRGLHDKSGKPLMFGITFDGTLAAVGPAFGDAEAVQVERPAPALPFTHAVAGSQNRKGEIWLAASFGTDADSASSLYVCGPLSNDAAGWLAGGGGPGVARFKWAPKRTGGEKTHIPEIQIGTDDDDQGPPMILIATTLKTGKVPRYERLSAAPGDDLAEQFPMFEDATELLDVVLASRPKGRGAYALYRVGTRGTRRLEFAGVLDPEYHVPTAPFTLVTPPGAMSLKTEADEDGYTDLMVRGNGVFRFSSARQTSYAQGEPIAADTLSSARVTSRSVLTDDYGHNEQGVFGARKAFRSTITVPADTCQVQVWATEATPAEVDGRAVTLDPVKALRVAPSAVSRLTVSLPAKGITCPTLMIRTDQMSYHQRLYIFPDVGLHRTIAELPAGSLWEARERLGMGGMLGRGVEGVQKVLQNLTRSIQYTHNRTDYGFHHDRTVYANNLDDAHFSLLNTAWGEPSYEGLSRQQAQSSVHGPEAPVTTDDLKSALGNLESVTITTLEKLGGDVAYAAGRVGEDLQQMLSRMGDDLVQGDLFGVVSDLIQGGENVRTDLFKGAANVFGDVIEGEAKILFAVVKLGGQTLKFVLQNTGDVGKLLLWLLEKLGVQIEKLVAYLAKAVGWDDILKTHDVVKDMINRDLDMLADSVGELRERGAAALQTAKQNMSAVLDRAIVPLGGVPARDQTLSNEFFEASEWLAHSLASNPTRVREIDNLSSSSPLQNGYDLIEKVMNSHLRGGGMEVITALNAAGIDFEKFRQNRDHPELLLASMLEIIKALGTIALEVVGAVWDALMGMLELFLRAVKRILNEELNVPLLSDFYSFITKGENGEGKRLSLLSVTSLLIAIPATPIYRSMVKEAPFGGAQFAMGLDPMSHEMVTAGTISYATQLAMAVTNIPLSISTLFNITKNDATPGWLAAIGIVDFGLSFISNYYSTVVGYQHTTKDSFWDYHNEVTAPAAMGKILLAFSFVPICVGGLATLGSLVRLGKNSVPGDGSQKAVDVLKILRSFASMIQGVLAGLQQGHEYEKKLLLNKLPEVFWNGKPGIGEETILRDGLIQTVDVGLSEPERTKANNTINSASLEVLRVNRNILKNYHDWAGNGGIAEKGYAIFMGIFPHTAQSLMTYMAGQASEEMLPFVGAGLINHCRLAGGFTALGRTKKNALL
jgi:hypothetical protein